MPGRLGRLVPPAGQSRGLGLCILLQGVLRGAGAPSACTPRSRIRSSFLVLEVSLEPPLC